MKTSVNTHQLPLQLRAIRGAAFKVARTRVVCTLYAMEKQLPEEAYTDAVGYAIGMRAADSRYLYFLGHDAAKADRIFDCVTAYKVSPCTLKDVLDDLMVE